MLDRRRQRGTDLLRTAAGKAAAAAVSVTSTARPSVTATADIVTELPALAAAINAGSLTTDALAFPLVDIEQAWGHEGTERIVMTTPALTTG